MFNRVVKTLTDLRHVPELTRNLISLSALNLKGYRYIDEGGVLKVSKGVLVLKKGHKNSIQLYILQGSTVIGDATVSTSFFTDDEVTKLWHIRFGHVNENEMAELSRWRLLDG